MVGADSDGQSQACPDHVNLLPVMTRGMSSEQALAEQGPSSALVGQYHLCRDYKIL